MPVTVTFSDEEFEYLHGALGLWIDGYEEAIKEVACDRTHDSPEDLLGAVFGIEYDYGLSLIISEKLQEAKSGKYARAL